MIEAHLICLFNVCHASISYYFVCLVYDILLMWVVIFAFVLCSVFASSISANLNSIPVLDDTNFKKWKKHIVIVLGCMDLDLALKKEQPAALTDESSDIDVKNFEQ